MPIIEKGRTCIITRGSDAGKKVVIKEVIDKNFVTIAGEDVKERRSNIRHLAPLSETAKASKSKTVKRKEKKEKPKKIKIKKSKLSKKEKKKSKTEKPKAEKKPIAKKEKH